MSHVMFYSSPSYLWHRGRITTIILKYKQKLKRTEAVARRCSVKKQLCQSPFFKKVAGLTCNFIKKETLAQVFSCKFCEISKNTSGGCFWKKHQLDTFLNNWNNVWISQQILKQTTETNLVYLLQ